MSKTVVYNKSKTYLLPLLSELIEFDFKFMDYLDNTFMYEDSGKYKEHFFILHNYAFTDPEFTRYESKLTDNELFVDYVDVGNKVLYIYKFPEEYLHEYYALSKGRYSAFGTDAKDKILEFWTEAYKNVTAAVPVLLKIKQILFKDEKLRQQLEKELSSKKHKIFIMKGAELGSIPEPEDETFELAQYLKK